MGEGQEFGNEQKGVKKIMSRRLTKWDLDEFFEKGRERFPAAYANAELSDDGIAGVDYETLRDELSQEAERVMKNLVSKQKKFAGFDLKDFKPDKRSLKKLNQPNWRDETKTLKAVHKALMKLQGLVQSQKKDRTPLDYDEVLAEIDDIARKLEINGRKPDSLDFKFYRKLRICYGFNDVGLIVSDLMLYLKEINDICMLSVPYADADGTVHLLVPLNFIPSTEFPRLTSLDVRLSYGSGQGWLAGKFVQWCDVSSLGTANARDLAKLSAEEFQASLRSAGSKEEKLPMIIEKQEERLAMFAMRPEGRDGDREARDQWGAFLFSHSRRSRDLTFDVHYCFAADSANYEAKVTAKLSPESITAGAEVSKKTRGLKIPGFFRVDLKESSAAELIDNTRPQDGRKRKGS